MPRRICEFTVVEVSEYDGGAGTRVVLHVESDVDARYFASRYMDTTYIELPEPADARVFRVHTSKPQAGREARTAPKNPSEENPDD